MKKQSIKVSQSVKKLIETIKQIEYGEIANIAIDSRGGDASIVVEEPFAKLAELFAQYPKVDQIMIHQGYPAYAIISMEINGLKCQKRFKLM